FTAFARADRERWGEAYAHTRYDFIDQMEGEISKPILPFDRQREYIPTQIVAEYIREYFGCDAVIYRSSMIKDRDKESRNIVFLNRGEAFTGTQSGLVAAMLASRDFKGIRRKRLPIFMLGADHAFQASFERQTPHSQPASSGHELARI